MMPAHTRSQGPPDPEPVPASRPRAEGPRIRALRPAVGGTLAVLLAALLLAIAVILGGGQAATQPPLWIDGSPRGQVATNATWDHVVRVIDGDTVVLASAYLPEPLHGTLRLRLHGIDCPETGWRAACAAEASRGAEASELVRALLFPEGDQYPVSVRVCFRGWDAHGGRAVGSLTVSTANASVDLAEALLAEGLAQPYNPSRGDPRPMWCS